MQTACGGQLAGLEERSILGSHIGTNPSPHMHVLSDPLLADYQFHSIKVGCLHHSHLVPRLSTVFIGCKATFWPTISTDSASISHMLADTKLDQQRWRIFSSDESSLQRIDSFIYIGIALQSILHRSAQRCGSSMSLLAPFGLRTIEQV